MSPLLGCVIGLVGRGPKQSRVCDYRCGRHTISSQGEPGLGSTAQTWAGTSAIFFWSIFGTSPATHCHPNLRFRTSA